MTIAFDKDEKFFLLDNQIKEIPAHRKYDIPNDSPIFYEVIRVINSTPLFVDEHIERLKKSTLLSGIEALETNELTKAITEFTKHRQIHEKNLKISLYTDKQNKKDYHVLAYFVSSSYPQPEAYLNGVKVELIPLKRENPNVKLENPTLRSSADKVICLSQTYEALLVNNEGYITEGSRSNFFAIINNTIITPPSKDVLEGITRKMVFALATQNGIPLVERCIHKSEIDSFEGAFLTGTSTKVLPINRIGDKTLPGHNLIQKIILLYNKLVEKNLVKTSNKYNNTH